jgi:GNAT superfamily N-acetyltransferase
MHSDQQKHQSNSQDSPLGARQISTDVVLFDPMTACRTQWDRFHAYRRARHDEAWPDDPMISDQESEEDERDPSPHGDRLRWVAVEQGGIVGGVSSYLQHPESPGFAERARFLHANGAVLKPWRGRGIGTRLLAQVHGLMLEHVKAILTLSTHEPDGHGFLRHIGASEKTISFENLLLLQEVDWVTSESWEAAALASLPGSRFVHHGPRVSKEIYQALKPLLDALSEDVPLDQLEHAPIRTEMSEIDEWHRQLDRIGGAEHFLVLRDRDGSVIGLTEVVWFSRRPDRVYQMFTGVRRDKRGAGYARGIKAAMLREIRTRYPSVSKVVTHNGRSNGPMLSINRKLGFKVHRQLGTYQIDRDAIGAWLSGARRTSGSLQIGRPDVS